MYGYTRDDWFALLERVDLVVFDLFGRTFVPEHWRLPNVPWYFIGATRGSDDERFVRFNLQELIRSEHGKWRRGWFKRTVHVIKRRIKQRVWR